MKKGLGIVLAVFLLGGCAGTKKAGEPAGPRALCVLSPTKGNQVKGTVEFIQEKNGVRVVALVEGLTPGKHGFHIHEKGDCSAPDALSAGGHFNPGGHDHGSPSAKARHAGDMGNLKADSKGIAKLSYLDKHMVLKGKGSIIGKGIIVHEKEDDLKTQPTGNAGARVACGVIKSSKR